MLRPFFRKLTASFSSEIKRKAFNSITEKDITHFKGILSDKAVLTDKHEVQPFNTCFRKLDIGASQLVLMPSKTEEVSSILKYCNQNNLAVVPQGGNTGLVGGSVPVFDEVILNLQKMNKIESFSKVSSVLNCEAGCILESLNNFLQPQGFEVPLDLGAKGSCQIGGNAATNAGGKYVVKYGSLRSHILGMEVVLPNGDVLDLRSQIQKDNTGYDLKQLFIASEGTLGVITKLNIYCEKLDQSRRIVVLKTNSFQNILKLVPQVKQRLGKELNALQYMDGHTYNMVEGFINAQIFTEVQNQSHLLFVELTSEAAEEIVGSIIENESFSVEDAIISNSDKEFKKIWRVREDVAIQAVKKGKILSYDISFDVTKWASLLQKLRKDRSLPVYGYGHIGDGNLHVNMVVEEGKMKWHDEEIFRQVTKMKGSISAEHGVGLHKPQHLHLQKSPQILELFRSIKKIFDPKGIMNPYKVVPDY